MPIDFILFGATLLGVALFHHHTLRVALIGLAVITAYKLAFTGFKTGPGLGGLALHLEHEWVILANLFLLLMGFALLSRHFEKSRVPVMLPRFLPTDWKGAFVLLVMVFVLSSFLDNIAAALIGGAMAHQLFRAKVHIGYLAAIVAASNAGGSGSVIGDTTTTMMWIAGVSPAQRVRGVHRGHGGARDLRNPCRQAAARLFAHDPPRARAHPHRLGAARHRRADPGLRHRRQRRAEPAVPATSPACSR